MQLEPFVYGDGPWYTRLFPALALEPALAGRMTKTYHGETMSTKEYRRRLWLYNAHVRRMSDSERRAFVDELTGMKTEYAREADELFRYARTYAKSVMAARKHLHDDCRCPAVFDGWDFVF